VIGLAVIVHQGVVDGFDALTVAVGVGIVVGVVNGMVGFDAQFGFQRADEGIKQVNLKAFGVGFDKFAQLLIDQCGENQRRLTAAFGQITDFLQRGVGFVHIVHERDAMRFGRDVKLCQERLCKSLGGDSCAI
jgi:hypothetical protein